MSPKALLPLLLLLLLKSESADTSAYNNTGKDFIIIFPENMAYYHPVPPKNMAQVVALFNDTVVEITTYTYHQTKENMSAGETRDFIFDARVELSKVEVSSKIIHITSNKAIAVYAISLKNNSVQTALVIPTEKLGTKYFIPPVPTIRRTTDPPGDVTKSVTERGPFRIIIVNTKQDNNVKLTGTVVKNYRLEPNQATQIWVEDGEDLRVVSANQPVVVLFGHPCALRSECTCGLLYTILPPAKDDTLKFFIPPVLAKDAEDETVVLLSGAESTKIETFSSASPLVEIAGTAILYRPGLLLTLIPEADFAGCYAITFIPEVQNFVVIVVHKDVTEGVHIGSDPLQSPDWQRLQGTEYVSARIELRLGKSFVWHPTSKIAVYLLRGKGNYLVGNPGSIISITPDFRGCVVTPEVVHIGQVALGWRESLKYCEDEDLELVSFSKAKHQTQVSKKLVEAIRDSLLEVWIGMRRSSLTGYWYWVNGKPVGDTSWYKGEPGNKGDGQCAMIHLKNSEDFGWRDEDCCRKIPPVCHKDPTLLLL